MSVEHDTLSPATIVRDDFLDDANTSMLAGLGRFSPRYTAHLNRCATLAHITKQICSVQSGVNLLPIEDRSINQLCQEVLHTRIKHCNFVEQSPADIALEQVLKKMGLGNGAIENLRGMNEEATRKARDLVLKGFVTRLQEALQGEDFCKKQRAWLKSVNKNLETCDWLLDALEASSSLVYCVRHDVICQLDREGISQEESPRSLAQALFRLPADLGLIAVLCRGERLPSGDFRCHVVIFFGGGTNNDQQAVKMATQARLSHILGSTCTQPLGYRSAGEGLLTPGCKPLRQSLRSMLSRDEFVRSLCSPTLTFSFHRRDGDTFRFPAYPCEVACEA